jgi:RNA-binding protein NOB1
MADPLEENFNEHQPLNINANYEISNDRKPIHTLILDAGPLLKNTPPLSTLLAQSVELLTTPSVISEIRDPDARNRIDTFYLPFLKQRKPSSKSVNVVSEFARKTGDRPVLSTTDIELIALAHELECERNGGDWRLRSVPGQKTLNGKPPSALATSTATAQEEEKEVTDADDDNDDHGDNGEKDTMIRTTATNTDEVSRVMENLGTIRLGEAEEEERTEELPQPLVETELVVELGGTKENDNEIEAVVEDKSEDHGKGDSGSDSEGGWITPSNYKKHQVQDEALSDAPEPKFMQVAMITTDFAVSFNMCILSRSIFPCDQEVLYTHHHRHDFVI